MWNLHWPCFLPESPFLLCICFPRTLSRPSELPLRQEYWLSFSHTKHTACIKDISYWLLPVSVPPSFCSLPQADSDPFPQFLDLQLAVCCAPSSFNHLASGFLLPLIDLQGTLPNLQPAPQSCCCTCGLCAVLIPAKLAAYPFPS